MRRKFIKFYTYGGIFIFVLFILISFLYLKKLEKNVVSIYIDSIKLNSNFLRSYFSTSYPSKKNSFFLDKFVISENLVYIAILDSLRNVKAWASAFEGFLPINAEGKYLKKDIKLISTPLGNILEIRGSFIDRKGNKAYFVAGYPYFLIEEKIVKESFSRTFILFLLTGIIFLTGLYLLMYVQKEIEEKEKRISEKEEFIKIATEVAHEIKNPLNVVAMGLQVLEQEEKDKERKNKIFLLRKEINKLSEHMNNLLKLKRPLVFEPEKITVDKFFKEIEILFKDIFEKKGIEFEVKILNKGEISGSYELLKQVLVNLLKNSFEATEKGKVVLGVKKDKKGWMIEIRDTGIGISEQELKKVFHEKFSTKEGGAGIGLLWVKKVIDAHKGKIEIKSKKNKGTIVKICLPFKI